MGAWCLLTHSYRSFRCFYIFSLGSRPTENTKLLRFEPGFQRLASIHLVILLDQGRIFYSNWSDYEGVIHGPQFFSQWWEVKTAPIARLFLGLFLTSFLLEHLPKALTHHSVKVPLCLPVTLYPWQLYILGSIVPKWMKKEKNCWGEGWAWHYQAKKGSHGFGIFCVSLPVDRGGLTHSFFPSSSQISVLFWFSSLSLGLWLSTQLPPHCS